ncbi:MAG: carbohydrate kinase family protein [Patescibacteria group bacterium]|nr:carbohydrate kinase family protein [Patescibacteria group bacterium]MBU1684120.1 carbohydrate kinase family protein [Patescibacteria group bacterium]
MALCNIITIGGAVEDITFHTDEGILINNKQDVLRQKLLAFEYGAKIKINKTFSFCGGGALNTAVNFSCLGFQTTILTAIGNDCRGKKIIQNLNKQKINTKLIQKIKDKPTGFSLILVDQNNEHIIFLDRGANSQLSINNYQLSILKQASWVYLTSLSGDWQNILERLFSVKNAEDHAGKIAWNPGTVQLQAGLNGLKKYLKKTNVLILNKDEALELAVSLSRQNSRISSGDIQDIKNLLKILKESGPEIIVITNGKKGAYAYNGKKYYYQKSVKIKKQMNTIGVGDMFGSSFVAGLKLYNNDVQKSMRFAAKNAALTASRGR